MVGGAAAGVGALSSVAENTREYRTEMGKLDTAFTTNKFTAADAKQTYSDLYAVVGDSGQATEAANHLSLLCDSTKTCKVGQRFAQVFTVNSVIPCLLRV